MVSSQKRNAHPFVTPQVNTSPFHTQPVQGGTVAPLFHLTVQYERYESRLRGRSCSADEPAAGVVTELSRHLCEKGQQVRRSADTVVLNVAPLLLPRCQGASPTEVALCRRCLVQCEKANPD